MKKPHGFTLIEVVVSLGIFLIAVFVVTQYIITAYNANRFALEQGDAIEHAKKGIDNMIKEIREASFAENGDYPIAEATNQSLTFYSDVDSDQAVEKIHYYLNGTNLVRGVIEPNMATNPPSYSGTEATQIISRYIRNGTDPVFYYYNGDYPEDTVNNPLISPPVTNLIRLIRLFLMVNIDPIKAPGDFNLEVFVQLRNLKDNL